MTKINKNDYDNDDTVAILIKFDSFIHIEKKKTYGDKCVPLRKIDILSEF